MLFETKNRHCHHVESWTQSKLKCPTVCMSTFAYSSPHSYWAADCYFCLHRTATTDDIQAAANLAAFFSKAKNENKAEVMYTLAKNLKKPRGSRPGQVNSHLHCMTWIRSCTSIRSTAMKFNILHDVEFTSHKKLIHLKGLPCMMQFRDVLSSRVSKT